MPKHRYGQGGGMSGAYAGTGTNQGGRGSSRPNLASMHKHPSEQVADQTRSEGMKAAKSSGSATGATTVNYGKLGSIKPHDGEAILDKNTAAAKKGKSSRMMY